MCCGPTRSPRLKDITLKITGMTCDDCAASATKALTSVRGVKEVQVDHVRGRSMVRAEADTDLSALLAALRAVGYGGEVV